MARPTLYATFRASWVSLIGIALALTTSSALSAEPPAFTTAESQRLQAGEILIDDASSASGMNGLRAAFLVKAKSAAVWNVLVDYRHYREVFTDVEALDVLEENDRGAQIRFHVKAAWMHFQYTLQRDYREPGHLLTWKRVAGDFTDLQGQWEIRDGFDADHVLVTCETFVDIGFLVPTTFVRNGAKADMSRTMRRLRERVEAQTEIGSEGSSTPQ